MERRGSTGSPNFLIGSKAIDPRDSPFMKDMSG
jgi:hypothetical protein